MARLKARFAGDDERLVLKFLAVSLFVSILAGIASLGAGSHMREGLQTAAATSFAALVLATVFGFVLRDREATVRLNLWIANNARVIIAIWIVLYLAWFGMILFANPFLYEINGGDSAFFTQTLWNLSHGFRPESSWLTLNGAISPTDDPRYTNAYGYVSIFTLHQYWLPMLLLTPLYALYSAPPMQVFATQICFAVIGIPGMYWAARKAGTGKSLAVCCAIGYSLLPQVGIQLFFLAYFDAVALAILPWLFGSYFAQRWRLTYGFAFLVALISFPFAVFVILFGFCVILSRDVRRGGIVMLIGAAVLRADFAIMMTTIAAYPRTPAQAGSLFSAYVSGRPFSSFLDIASFNFLYICFLIQGVAYLPFFAIVRRPTPKKTMAVLFGLLALAFIPMLFRSYGWQFQRNAFFIVPVFALGVVACVQLISQSRSHTEPGRLRAPSIILVSALVGTIFLGNPFRRGPLNSHFPWGSGVTVKPDASTYRWQRTLLVFNRIIPTDAPLAWEVSANIMALMTNRQHSWSIGREPPGVKYYAFVGDPQLADGPLRKAIWYDKLASMKADKAFRIIYEGNPGENLVILENLRRRPIPRNEKLLGWSVLMRPFKH